jgi:hypothetical protein
MLLIGCPSRVEGPPESRGKKRDLKGKCEGKGE